MKPHFTLNKNIVLQQYYKAEKISDIVSYSSKTNPLITPILEQETNAMFSIHLQNELKNVKDKSRILFLAQAWNHEQIESLINQGITWFVVDNTSDLEILVKHLETTDSKINLLLRLKLKERTLKTEKYYVFGMESKVINQKIKELTDHKNINNLGIHFHRKTQNMAEWNLQYEIEDVIEPDVLSKITTLNIGGGLPSNYANTNVKVIDSIFNKINELKLWLQTKNVKLMLEPGRFIAAPAGKLHTEIIVIHGNTIIVNASVYNSDMDALIVPVKLLVEGESNKENQETQPYIIKGTTPCSLDLFRYRVYLKKPKVGDNITFLNAGAYNFTTDFCDLEKIETDLIEENKATTTKQTWMNLPEEYTADTSKFIILPISYEKDLTFGTGTSKGPEAIIEASKHLEYYDDQFDCEPFEKGIKLLPQLNLNNETPEEMVEKVKEEVSKQNEKFIIALGGDHATTIGTVKGLEQLHNEFSVIQFDAHADFRDSWNNSSLNHACVAKQISKKHSLLQIGIRSIDVDEKNQLNQTEHVHTIKAYNFSLETIKSILPQLKQKIFITIDVDVFNPSIMRNTGTPEPGGLTWNQIIDTLKLIFQEKHVIGADITEFAPKANYESEAYALAKLIYKIIALDHSKTI